MTLIEPKSPESHFMPITIELDQAVATRRCSGCGREHETVRGYLYRDGNAWVAYWAALYRAGEHHAHPIALMTVAMGDDWADASDARARTWVQIEARPHADQVLMSFVDPSAQLDPELFGSPLSRSQALDSPRKPSFLEAAEHIAYEDSRVAHLLQTSRGN
jgi:hypothetical protein